MSAERVMLQLALSLVMLVCCMIAGVLPLRIVRRLKNSEKGAHHLSLLALFAGGVFMATCFMDILPDIQQNWDEYKVGVSNPIQFPLPYLFNCIGFLLVLLLEECLRMCAMGHTPIDEEKDGVTVASVGSELPDTALRWLTFTVVISVHSLLEGVALGVQSENVRIISLFLSLLLHKAIEAFSVGLVIAKAGHGRTRHLLLIAMYSFMTPVGVGLGVVLQEITFEATSKAFIIALIEATAGGTFLFITFIEIIGEEMAKKTSGFVELGAITAGVALTAAMQLVLGGHD